MELKSTFTHLHYERPDLDSLLAQIEERRVALEQAGSAAEQYDHWQEINALSADWHTAETLAHIRHSINSLDPFYKEEQDFYDAVSPRVQEIKVKLYRTLLGSPFRAELEETVGDHVFRMAELELKTFSPEVMDLLAQENRLVSEYNALRAAAQIEFRGQKLTLAQITPYTQDADPGVRREAIQKSTAFYAENLEAFDRIFDELVKLRTEIAHRLGYENYLALGYARMGRLDYGPKDVAGYREAVLKYIVPVAKKLRQRQAKRIGVKTLNFYDEGYEYPTGNPKPIGTEQEMLKHAQKMYHELAPEAGEFFDFMLEHELMDLQARTGKRGGGYCTFLINYRAPFIFSNFNGTAHDVEVLTHEAGHAFQVYRSRNAILPEYIWPTMESAEIHSMSMEFLTWPWMKPFFGESTQRFYFSHLAQSLNFIPYGCLVDHFQEEVYTHPELTPAERRQTWRRLEKKYLPHRRYEDLTVLEEGAFWFRQLHIYNMPLYYIDYTLAQVCAFQFWKLSRENRQQAWQQYLALCNAGGRYPFRKLVEIAGLRNPLDEGTLPAVVDEIAQYLDSVQEKELL